MAGQRRRSGNAPGLHILAREIAAELVGSAGVTGDDLVLDLGAGTGALTVPLARTGARVVAVECSPRLADRLRRRHANAPNVRVVEDDMLAIPLPRRPYRVVANLPFSIAMTVLGRLLDDPHGALRRADLVVPWHVAVRLTGGGHRRSRRWHRRYDLRVDRRLPPRAFVPHPSVVAAVLVVERRVRSSR